jgi:glycosyltransferase involved in cell wall biosynthesis
MRHGWSVYGVALTGSRVAYSFEKGGVDCLTFKSRASALFSLVTIIKYIRRKGVGVVHAHKSSDIRIAALIGQLCPDIKVFFTDHMGVKKPKRDLYHRWAYSKVTRAFSISQFTYCWNQASLPLPEGRLTQLYYGIDLSAYENSLTRNERSTIRRSLGVTANSVVIALPGRIDRSKGHDVWLRALKLLSEESELPPWQALIIGESAPNDVDARRFQNELEEFVDRKQLSACVRFVGFRTDLAACLKAVDICCIPSVLEAFGLAVIESMAARCAIIGSSSGAIPELVDNSRGRIVDPREPEEWRDALKELLENDGLREALSYEGARWVTQKFSMEAHIGSLTYYYNNSSA